jgi:uncharacterized protein YndB with AHSA1/START domain
MQNEINNQWEFDQAPEHVWAYLTNADLMALWLMPNDFKPLLGQKFQFTVKPIPSLNLDGIMYCKVLELEPFQKLVYSWKAGPGGGEISLDTRVEWTLIKQGSGTKLILRHNGFEESNHSIFLGMSGGWESNVQKIIKHLNEFAFRSSNT